MTTPLQGRDQGPPHLPPQARRIAEQAVKYISARGLAEFQLREFAPSIGTSHRMIIHYFGSKSGLLAEVFRLLRVDEMAHFRQTATSPRQLLRDMWAYYTAEVNELRTLLFFELVGTACQRPTEFAHFLNAQESWVDLLADLIQADGVEPADARVRARAVVAGWGGLRLELFTRRDRAACDQALETLLDAFFPAHPERQDTARPATEGGT